MSDPYAHIAGDDPYAHIAVPHQEGPDTRPKSFKLGVDEGFGHVVDRFAGAVDAGLQRVGVPMDKINRAMGGETTTEVNARHQAELREREKTARPGAAGQLVGGAVAAVPIMAATRNPYIAGGITGALTGDSDTAGGVALDAAGGAALGKVGDVAVGAIGNALKPVVAPAVRRLQEAGVNLTPGMIRGGKAMAKEDKLTSRPVVGDAIAADRQQTLHTFNTAAVDRILRPLGFRLPQAAKAGHDAIEFAHEAVSKAYDDVVPHMQVQLDPQAFIGKIAPAAQTLAEAEKTQLSNIVSNTLKTGQLVGRQLKDAQGEIRRLASSYSRDPAAPARELGRVLHEVDDHLTEAMMAQNPKLAPRLQKANEAFRGLTIVEDAASRADEGILNTGQLKQAVRRADPSRRKSAVARGQAFLQDFSEDARAVIPSRIPNSGTADRQQAGSVVNALRGTAELAGYRGRQAVDHFNALRRPEWLERAGDFLLTHRGRTAVPAATRRKD